MSSAGGLWSKHAISINIRGGSCGPICILTIPGCAENADSSKDACEVFVLATREASERRLWRSEQQMYEFNGQGPGISF